MKTENFETIATFNSPHEMAVSLSLLKSNGIDYFLPDENVQFMDSLRLQVKESDVEQATIILKEGGFI